MRVIITKEFVVRQLRDLAIVLLIGVTISTIFTGLNIWTSLAAIKKVVLYSIVIGYSLWKSNELITAVVEYFLPKGFSPKKALLCDIAASFVISALVIFVVNHFMFPYLYGFSIYENSRLFILIGIIQLFISLLITSTFYIKHFYSQWIDATVNEEKLKKEAILLRYNALKSNVNPHFLFNSLSVLSSLVDTDTEKAKEFILQFSNIYRYVLEQREKELVPLIDEIDFIKSYINLHLIRHENNLNVNINIKDSTGYIIPLSLQILLENCFKHNIISEENPLNINIWRENEYVWVENNIQKRKTLVESNGVGLDTIGKRYEYLSNRKIEVTNTNNLYTVKLPILTNFE
jgi:two-component system, LytTR family, sensor kinase